jgi:hypothetical protein
MIRNYWKSQLISGSTITVDHKLSILLLAVKLQCHYSFVNILQKQVSKIIRRIYELSNKVLYGVRQVDFMTGKKKMQW